MEISVSALRKRLGSLRQFAAVRQLTMDEGSSSGQRVLAFSTGGGLDFWVMVSRTMDIGPLWLKGVPMSWMHPAEFPAANYLNVEGDQLTGMERGLSGFLVTCGLDNVRQPNNGLPLHGHLPFTPARVTACGECWDADVPYLFAEGEVVTAHLNRSAHRLIRRIIAPIGGCTLEVVDRIENIGLSASEAQVLYHTNLGFPLVDAGVSVFLGESDESIIGADKGNSELLNVISCHSLRALNTQKTRVRSAISEFAPPIELIIKQNTESLPYVQFWRDQRSGRNILAIEPVNSQRNSDGSSQSGSLLSPGETMTTNILYEFKTLLNKF